MAVVDETLLEGEATKSYKVSGVDAIDIIARIPIANGDSIASIKRFAQVPAGYIPVSGEIITAGIAGLTDVDLGVYLDSEKAGLVKDVDLLVNGADLSAALAIGSGVNVIRDYGTDNVDKPLQEVLADGKAEFQAYVLALTLNTAATAAGDILVKIRLINGA